VRTGAEKGTGGPKSSMSDVPMLFVGFVFLSKRFSSRVYVQVSIARPFALISNPGSIHTFQFAGGLFGSR